MTISPANTPWERPPTTVEYSSSIAIARERVQDMALPCHYWYTEVPDAPEEVRKWAVSEE